jgi:hypothetical protein
MRSAREPKKWTQKKFKTDVAMVFKLKKKNAILSPLSATHDLHVNLELFMASFV